MSFQKEICTVSRDWCPEANVIALGPGLTGRADPSWDSWTVAFDVLVYMMCTSWLLSRRGQQEKGPRQGLFCPVSLFPQNAAVEFAVVESRSRERNGAAKAHLRQDRTGGSKLHEETQ